MIGVHQDVRHRPRVEVHCHLDERVTEQFLDSTRIHVSRIQQRRERMPQRMHQRPPLHPVVHPRPPVALSHQILKLTPRQPPPRTRYEQRRPRRRYLTVPPEPPRPPRQIQLQQHLPFE